MSRTSTAMQEKKKAEVLVPEPPLGDLVDSAPFQLSHHDSVGRSERGPGYPRHCKIHVELGYAHTNFDR